MGRPRLPLVEQPCEGCGATFLRKNYERTRRFCGQSCSGSANKAKARDISGANNPRYNGGLSTTSDGRTVIVCRDYSLVFFYRAVIEAHLRRPLSPDEIVHHINGDPTDDRVENLEITTRSEHLKHHRPEFEAKRKDAARVARERGDAHRGRGSRDDIFLHR